jgi:hypothetical protein
MAQSLVAITLLGIHSQHAPGTALRAHESEKASSSALAIQGTRRVRFRKPTSRKKSVCFCSNTSLAPRRPLQDELSVTQQASTKLNTAMSVRASSNRPLIVNCRMSKCDFNIPGRHGVFQITPRLFKTRPHINSLASHHQRVAKRKERKNSTFMRPSDDARCDTVHAHIAQLATPLLRGEAIADGASYCFERKAAYMCSMPGSTDR